VSEVLDIRVVDHAFMAKFDLELRMAASLYDKLNEADDVRYDRLFAFVNLAEVIHVPDRRVVRTDGEVRVKLVLRARFSTYFQLATFPHDSHRLEIKLTSNIPCALGPAEDAGSPQVTLNMLPDNTKPNVMRATHSFVARDTWTLSPEISTEEWQSDPSQSGTGAQYAHLYFTFLIRRRAAFFHWNVSLPIFTLTTLAFAVLAIDDEPTRVSANLTLVLHTEVEPNLRLRMLPNAAHRH